MLDKCDYGTYQTPYVCSLCVIRHHPICMRNTIFTQMSSTKLWIVHNIIDVLTWGNTQDASTQKWLGRHATDCAHYPYVLCYTKLLNMMWRDTFYFQCVNGENKITFYMRGACLYTPLDCQSCNYFEWTWSVCVTPDFTGIWRPCLTALMLCIGHAWWEYQLGYFRTYSTLNKLTRMTRLPLLLIITAKWIASVTYTAETVPWTVCVGHWFRAHIIMVMSHIAKRSLSITSFSCTFFTFIC